MAGFSRTINDQTLDLIPSPCFVALNNVMPTDDDGQGGTEFSTSGIGYSPQSCTWGAKFTDTDTKRAKSNSAQVQFGPFSATTPLMRGYTIWNHATNRSAANFVAAVTFDVADQQTFSTGSTYTFNVGTIKLKAD